MGTEERSEHYKMMDVCLVCYSSLELPTFENVKSKWLPEIHRYNPKAMVIVVETKTDLKRNVVECLRNVFGRKLKPSLPTIEEVVPDGNDDDDGVWQCSAKSEKEAENCKRLFNFAVTSNAKYIRNVYQKDGEQEEGNERPVTRAFSRAMKRLKAVEAFKQLQYKMRDQ